MQFEYYQLGLYCFWKINDAGGRYRVSVSQLKAGGGKVISRSVNPQPEKGIYTTICLQRGPADEICQGLLLQGIVVDNDPIPHMLGRNQ